jgi:TatD DNase family protein
MIETHCHLDYLKSFPLPEILAKAKCKGVQKILTISVEPSHWDHILELTTLDEMIFASIGVHPHHAKESCSQDLQRMEELLQKSSTGAKKIVAIGEAGLDYYYLHSPKELQHERFEQQIQMACDLNYPLVIHTRDADEDCENILKNSSSLLNRKGVLHSFTSGKKLAEWALSEGFYLGFNGMITFKNADHVRSILELCPIDRVLLETDAPFLTPVPHRGKENMPSYLIHIAEKVAEVKNIALETVILETTKNAHQLFWPSVL